jgi:hypothetical protein
VRPRSHARGLPRLGPIQRCCWPHLNPAVTCPLTVIGCCHSLGIYIPILLSLLSFPVQMTVSPTASALGRRGRSHPPPLPRSPPFSLDCGFGVVSVSSIQRSCWFWDVSRSAVYHRTARGEAHTVDAAGNAQPHPRWGIGRTVALHRRPSTLHHIYEQVRSIYF